MTVTQVLIRPIKVGSEKPLPLVEPLIFANLGKWEKPSGETPTLHPYWYELLRPINSASIYNTVIKSQFREQVRLYLTAFALQKANNTKSEAALP